MLGMSVSKSPTGEGDRGAYEYGEYDGVMDVDAILHPSAGGGGTLTPTASSTAVGSDVVGYANYMSLHGDQSHGSTPAPQSRGAAPRKPPRRSASPSRNGTPRHSAALVTGLSLDPGDSLELGSPVEAATANGRGSGARKPATDDVVHLPAIAHTGFGNSTSSQQGRRRAPDAAPPPPPSQQQQQQQQQQQRTRAAASAHSPSNGGHSSKARAVAAFAKSVTSAGNLKSLQAGGNGEGVVGSNSNNYVAPLAHPSTGGPGKPPFRAPPLTGLTGKCRQQSLPSHPPTSDEELLTGGGGKKANGGSGGSNGMSSTKTNGWVKEVARRLDQRASGSYETPSPVSCDGDRGHEAAGNGFKPRNMAQLVAAEFPQERMRGKTALDGGRRSSVQPVDTAGEGDDGHGSEGSPRTKVNTSPAPVTPRAHVWAGDYGISSNLGPGSTDLSVVPMPKVTTGPRLFAGSLKTGAASPSGPAALPQPSTQSPLRAGAATAGTAGSHSHKNGAVSPNDSIITPLRKVFPRPQKPATMGVSAGAAGVLPHAPLAHPPTSAPGRPTGAAAAVAAAPDRDTTKTASASPHLSAATAAGKTGVAAAAAAAVGGQHTPNVSHRRIVMNAVDTSQHTHLHTSVGADQLGGKTQTTTAGPSRVPVTGPSATQANALPYSDERRAALEAWADVPVLAVTIRTQAPTPTQRAREAARMHARQSHARQMCVAANGQGRQEVAGEPFEMNYDVHNVVVQLRHRNRPLVMNYPPRLPLEVDMRPRMRRQRTPRSFYGERLPHVGDTWFRDALRDARMVQSPNIEEIEKREEAEFIRNGGDPATRRNRYAQSNNPHGPQQQQQNRAGGGGAGGNGGGGGAGAVKNGDDIEAMNRNAVCMEQPAS